MGLVLGMRDQQPVERRQLGEGGAHARGVEVPEGRHRVTFRFRPLGLDNLRAAVLQVRSGPRRDLLPADFDGWRR